MLLTRNVIIVSLALGLCAISGTAEANCQDFARLYADARPEEVRDFSQKLDALKVCLRNDEIAAAENAQPQPNVNAEPPFRWTVGGPVDTGGPLLMCPTADGPCRNGMVINPGTVLYPRLVDMALAAGVVSDRNAPFAIFADDPFLMGRFAALEAGDLAAFNDIEFGIDPVLLYVPIVRQIAPELVLAPATGPNAPVVYQFEVAPRVEDVRGGATIWQVTTDRMAAPTFASAAQLLFNPGPMVALDNPAGDIVFTFRTAARTNGAPITYVGPDGRNYVAYIASSSVQAAGEIDPQRWRRPSSYSSTSMFVIALPP